MAVRRVAWPQAWRIVASRHPPIDLFERVSPDPSVWEALMELEQQTNPRLRDEVGTISLVPPEDRVSGPGASYVMASFTHVNPKGSRFGDGRFGVYYAASSLDTAIAETIFHFEAFARDSGDPTRQEDMRVLVGAIDGTFEDVDALDPDTRAAVLDPDSYAAARAYAAPLREAGSAGVVYPSVRFAGGWCVGAFRPNAVEPPRQERHLRYRYNGMAVTRYFDFSLERWIDWPPARQNTTEPSPG